MPAWLPEGERARRILVVLHDLPLGGSERIAVRLANRWAQSGRSVTILCGAKDGPLGWLIDPAVELVECNPPIPRAKGSRRRLGRAVAAFLTERPQDILFTPGNYHWPIMPAVAALPAAIRPAVVAQAGTPLFRRGRGPIRQIAYNLRTRRQFRGADAAVTLSPDMSRDLAKVLGRRIDQCIRLPALEDDLGDEPRTRARGKTILAAGRLTEVKGFDVALRAFARLDDLDARLVIAGEGPCRAQLEALASALCIDHRVEFRGYVTDIRSALEDARLFLLSSHYEGYAAVVVEALDAGRPVVSTDCTPAAGELLGNPGAGAVAPVDDPMMLAKRLAQVMAQPAPDPDALAGLVAGYRIGPISDTYLQFFDTVKVRVAASLSKENP